MKKNEYKQNLFLIFVNEKEYIWLKSNSFWYFLMKKIKSDQNLFLLLLNENIQNITFLLFIKSEENVTFLIFLNEKKLKPKNISFLLYFLMRKIKSYENISVFVISWKEFIQNETYLIFIDG